jgi:hypothetical protein
VLLGNPKQQSALTTKYKNQNGLGQQTRAFSEIRGNKQQQQYFDKIYRRQSPN